MSTGKTGSRCRLRDRRSSATTPSGLDAGSGYSRHGRVLTAKPGREFAFITDEGGRESTVWRYRFESEAGGTRVTESYEVRWIPAWARILDVPLNRHKELVSNMRTTLQRLKAAADARSLHADTKESQS